MFPVGDMQWQRSEKCWHFCGKKMKWELSGLRNMTALFMSNFCSFCLRKNDQLLSLIAFKLFFKKFQDVPESKIIT